ncbi:MAG: DUF4065 domain-containing protein [Spirochaetota bacterium]|nr:DUF4065 domain-containing protein [Spirochaetota bacterium]
MTIQKTDTSVVDIVKELIVHHYSNGDGHDVTKTKILKQLFFAQSFSLYYFNYELFFEETEAWQYGPVVSTVYTNWESPSSLLNHTSIRNTDIFAKTIIEIIFEVTKSFKATELTDISHDIGSAWDHNYIEHDRKIISKTDIKEYFPVHTIITQALGAYFLEYKKYDLDSIDSSIKEMSFLC